MAPGDAGLHSVYGWLAVSLFAAVLSFFSCFKAMKLAQKSGMITEPGQRQSHRVATPTGGGLGLVFSVAITSLCLHFVFPLPVFWWQSVLPGVLLLALVGWFDDKHRVSSVLRLLVQLAVSVWLLGFYTVGFWLGNMGMFLVAMLVMVWMMNLYNFMDGSNGMAGFQGVFAGVTLAVLLQLGGQSPMALLALVVAATCAGFLPLNFPRARVFMGDVASVPLGFMFASIAVYGIQAGVLSWPVACLIMSVFIVDATMTLFARVIGGEQWYTAHAQHIYQKLIGQGWSHQRVLGLYQAINVVVVLPAVLLAEMYPQYAIISAGFTFLLLGTCWYFAHGRLGMLAEVHKK